MDIEVGLSNHHVHLNRESCDILFGKDYELTCKRNLKQLTQYACNETLTVIINDYIIENVRIIGPVRNYTQLELLESDCVNAGVKCIYSDSGKLEGTHSFELVGPKGRMKFDEGGFIANNHIHMSSEDLKDFNLKNGDFVTVKINDNILKNIKIKSDETCVLEMHMNKDEALKIGINNFDKVYII